EDGRRLRADGKDVVVGIVETHGRAATAAMTEGFPSVPRTRVEHRGVTLEEMDLEALLHRKPAVALVDELAHTNAPGSKNDKRWQDVEELLAAGDRCDLHPQHPAHRGRSAPARGRERRRRRDRGNPRTCRDRSHDRGI
ncbi:hypothetical protein D9B85_13405, partial [Corynebacterium diphtheriae]